MPDGKATPLEYLRSKEFFSGKRSVLVAQGLLLVVFLIMVLAVSITVRNSSEARLIQHEKQVRDAYAAQSDLHRLTNLLLRAKLDGGALSVEARSEIQRASDMLWVRTDDISIQDTGAPENVELRSLKTAMFDVVAASEEYIERPNANVTIAQLAPLTSAAEEARIATIQFIDVMRAAHDRLITSQSRVLRIQNAVMLAMAAILTLSGMVLLAQLRREVLLRKAQAASEKRALFLASHDSLTGLPKRVTFIDQVLRSPAQSGRQPSAIWVIDIDHFKTINDRLGHTIGDEVLKTQSARITSAIASHHGVAARIAGDEFALWLPGDEHQQTGLANDILKACRVPINHNGMRIESSISVGIAPIPATELNVADIERRLRHADFALYIAKSEGKDRYAIFDKELSASYAKRTAMLGKLKADVAEGKIDVYLQPKIDLADNRCYGFEALARWSYEGQTVPAEIFVELAEKAAFSSWIDSCVLRKAVERVSRWNRDNATDYSVAVNLSAAHVNDTALPREIEGLLEETRLEPAQLTLEVTETTEIRDWGRTTSILAAVRALGCKVAIDDFGTGYSSLAYLEKMQVDELKIDRSFILSAEVSEKTRFLLRAVIEYAQKHLGMRIVCEGIETEAQLTVVRSLEANAAQGFYWGKPQPAQDALKAAMQKA